MGKDRVALENHRDPAAAGRQFGRVAPADEHAAAVHLLEAGEAAEQRRLSAARGAEEDDEIAVRDIEGDVVDGGDLAERLANCLELDVGHYFNTRPHIVNR